MKKILITESERNSILSMYKNIDITTKIKLTESDLKKTVKKVLKEDPAPLPNMENVSLGKVKAVQQALVNAGYYIGNTGDNEDGIDGIFGKNTRAAVIKYQRDNGIKQTGNVGTITSGKLGVSPLTSGNPSQPQNNGKVGDSNSQNTTYDKNYDYKKENGQYYYKLKSSDKWILSTGKNKDAIASKVFNKTNTSTSKPNTVKKEVTTQKVLEGNCQIITKNSTDIKNLSGLYNLYKSKYSTFTEDKIYTHINLLVNSLSRVFTSQGIPKEISCEMALNHIRPGYHDKNLIVVDTYNKLLYVFDKSGKFINKTEVISGKNKQSVDPKVIAKALMTWHEQVEKIGFKWVMGKGYIDQTGKGRKYDDELVYANTDENNLRFLPKGIYTTSNKTHSDPEYAGKKNNMLSLFDGNTEISQAIHGYYVEAPRIKALSAAKKVISAPNDPRIGQEFLKLVRGGNVNLSQSYGCINVPESFLPILNKYVVDSYVFSIGEDRQNYLVQTDNVKNYFDKMTNSESCPSPISVGAIPLENVA